jgi:hypothetical protein
MRWGVAVLGMFFAVFVAGKSAGAATEEARCAAAHAQWAQTYELLKEAVNGLREAEAESIEPKINQTLTDGTRVSVAHKIQMILKDRSRRISEAARKSADAAENERGAFEQLRRCSSADSPRRSAAQATFNMAVRERSKLLADLQDLLLEEAYVQYKRESPNPPSTYSGYGPDQQSAQYQYQYQQPGQGRQMGYGPYAPGYGYQ